MNGQGAGFEEIFLSERSGAALARSRPGGNAASIFYPQFVWITLCIRSQQQT